MDIKNSILYFVFLPKENNLLTGKFHDFSIGKRNLPVWRSFFLVGKNKQNKS